MVSDKTKRIIVICIVVIIAAIVVVGICTRCAKKETPTVNTSEVITDSVPKLSAYYGTEKIGNIYGYTNKLNEGSERNTIVVISPEKKTEFKLDTKSNDVESIKYEIKSEEDGRLVDKGDIEKLEGTGADCSFTFNATTIMQPGVEYRLNFIITSDKHEEVYYYTRAVIANRDFMPEQIKFAKEFSDRTFKETEDSDLVGYLETNPKIMSNDNLGQITINSSYTMLVWSTLSPKKVGETTVTTKECTIKDTGEAVTYTLNYQIEATNAQKVKEIYNVWETITVFSYNGHQYITGYDREVNQIWEPTKNNIGKSFIDLGIQNIKKIEHCESENKKHIAYAINGDVYSMNLDTLEFHQIYKLNAKSSETLEMTKTKVVNIDNNGNVDYMIYGLSPANNHKGRNGISIMTYNVAKNESMEQTFIPVKSTAEVLDNQLKTLCHVGDGTLYIMLDDTIYFANLKTQEWGQIVAHLEDSSYAMSEDGKYLAYNTNATRENSGSITIIDLDSGEKKTIKSENGEKLCVCGYTGRSLVYGSAKKSDIKNNGFFAMNKLVIVDEKLNEVKTYSKPKVFIKNIDVKDGIINIKRWAKGKDISDDQILDNTEEAMPVVTSSYYSDDIKMKELALSFTTKLPQNKKIKINKQGKIKFNDQAEVNANLEKKEDKEYYVYGYGKLQDVTINQKDGISLAKKVYGLVTDVNGRKLWTKEEHYDD